MNTTTRHFLTAVDLVENADVIYFSRDAAWRFEKDGVITHVVRNPKKGLTFDGCYALWSAINALLTEDDFPGDYDHQHVEYGTPYRRATAR